MSTTSTSPTPWATEFHSRVEKFAEAIEAAPDVVLEIFKNEFGIDDNKPDCLTILDSEEFLTASDLFKAFVDTKVAKIARVRMGMPHLRGKTHLEEPKPVANGIDKIADAVKEMVSQNKPIESWSIEELLEKYDESHPEVIKRLSSLTHGRPCIVLNRVNGEIQINTPESAKMVKFAMKQMTSDHAMVAGKLVKVYRVGSEFPIEPIAEAPFCPGVALVNGFCAFSNTDWNGIDDEARILVRIYARHVETAQLPKKQMREICEDARKGAEYFREQYPEAALKYDEMKVQDKLPKLKILPSEAKNESPGRRDSGF